MTLGEAAIKTHDQVTFLRAKAKAIAESGALIPEDAARLVARQEWEFARIEKGALPKSAFRNLDSELELRLRLAFRQRSAADEIRKRLQAEFGFSSLAVTPDVVAKKVLRRGRISTADEADQMRELLTEIDSCSDYLGEVDTLRLSGLLAKWERGSSE